MNTQTSNSLCPGCGAAIPAEAPQGLCPRCLLAGVAQPGETVATAKATVDIPPLAAVAAAFPHLEILECIGQGGMGVVYKARQTRLERMVALKVLPRHRAEDRSFRERFTREGRLLARLNHPNVVAVYDFGEAGGFFYLLMEYVDGANLRQAMRAGRFSPDQALDIVPRICEALQYAHGEGVLHRDIKPENILLDTRGRVKIADFGIAKLLGEPEPGRTLTATGAAIGTPQYMAPEQIEHPKDVDHRADIFSLGVVFYEMLTGELPLGRFAPPSAKTPVDARVDEVVMRTLEKEPDKRYQSAGEVKTEVEGIKAHGGGRPTAPPTSGGSPGYSPSAARMSSGAESGSSGAADPAGAAGAVSGPGFQIAPQHRPLVVLGLAVAVVVLGLHVMQWSGLLVGVLATSVRAGIGPALWAIGAVIAGGWLVYASWRHRRRLLEPLGIPGNEIEPSEGVRFWAPGRVLGTVAVAALLAVACDVATQVVLLVSGLQGLVRLFPGSVLVVLVGAATAFWWWRGGPPQVARAPAEAPAWQRRVGVLFLVLGGAGLLAGLIPAGEGVRSWRCEVLLAVTGVALLTRSRAWRAVALAVNSLLFAFGTVQILALAIMLVRAARGAADVPYPVGGVDVRLAMLLGGCLTVGFAAAFWVLCRRDVRAGFGLRDPAPSAGQGAGVACPDAKFSVKAIGSVLLVGSSLFLTLAFLAWMVTVGFREGARGGLVVGRPGLLLVSALGVFAVGAAVAGTVLGIVSWREIGRSAGRLRGKALAIAGALTWPAVVVLAAPLVLLSVGWFRFDAPTVSRATVESNGVAAAGVCFVYRIPAGQVAVCELGELQDGEFRPTAGGALFVLAPAEAAGDAELRFSPVASGPGAGAPGTWGLRLVVGDSHAAASGLRLPAGLSRSIPARTNVGLEPDAEQVNLFPRSDPAEPAVGVRVRTCAHGLKGIVPGGQRSFGFGTNWKAGAASQGG